MTPTLHFEDAVRRRLNGDAQKIALDFAVFMRENVFLSVKDVEWSMKYNGHNFGCFTIAKMTGAEKDELWIWFGLDCDFDSCGPADDALKEAAWAHVAICPQRNYCSGFCKASQNQWKIFGKEYKSACHAPLAFCNPDAKTMEYVKKLMLMLKNNSIDKES